MDADLKQSLGITPRQRTTYHLLSYQAENYLATGNLKKAEALLQQADRIAKNLDNREVDLTNLLHQAAFSIAKGNRADAYEQLNSAVDLARRANIPDLEWRGHYLLGNLRRIEGDLTGTRDAYRQAMQIVESLDSNMPERELSISFLAERYDPYRAIVTLHSNELKDAVAAFGYFEKSKARALLSQLAGKTLNTRIRAQELVGDESKMLDVIRESLPRDLTLVEYFTGAAELLIFIISADSFHCVSLPVGSDQLASLANVFLDHLRNGRLAESKRSGQQLYKTLILPIKSHLKPQSTLCIVPDGSLFYIPFAVLSTKEGRFLIEDYRLTQAPSAAVLRQYLGLDKGTTDGKARKVLVVSMDEQLAEARSEAQMIYDDYKPYSEYRGQPDQRELTGLVPRFEILHFTGHAAVWHNGSPVLVFAPSGHSVGRGQPSWSTSQPGDNKERILRSDDIMRWDLSSVRLVCLSACDTGLGNYLHGEGVVGLTYAFLSAGAPALLASLWEVDGAATRNLMERFYANLQKAGMSKAEALRQAQIEILKFPGPYQAPYYWASFILIGDPR
jgi:CHAT domain-containing protein